VTLQACHVLNNTARYVGKKPGSTLITVHVA